MPRATHSCPALTDSLHPYPAPVNAEIATVQSEV